MAADPSLTPRQVKALSYWGVIESTRATNVSQSALWAAIHAEAQSRGEASLGFNAGDLARVLGFANSIRRTATDIAGASTDTPLTDISIGAAPWQRSLAEQATIPQWQARFIHTTTDADGNELLDWRTVTLTGTLPYTIGDLYDTLDAQAESMAAGYNVEHVSIEDLQLFAV